MNPLPEFTSSVVKLAIDVLQRSRQPYDQPRQDLVDAARSVASDPLLAAHADELRAELEAKRTLTRRSPHYAVACCSDYYRLFSELPQPADVRVDVWTDKGKSKSAKLGETEGEALLGARMFQYFERSASAVDFEAIELTFPSGRKTVLNADSLVPVENIKTQWFSPRLGIDFFYDDGRGAFHFNIGLSNRSYRRHTVEIASHWDKRDRLRRLGPADPVMDENIRSKTYFDTNSILAFADRVHGAGIDFTPQLEFRGNRLVRARDLRKGMKIYGLSTNDRKTKYSIREVRRTTISGGVSLYGDQVSPFYRLDGIPILSPPANLTDRWNLLFNLIGST